jgi:hypothetical protein
VIGNYLRIRSGSQSYGLRSCVIYAVIFGVFLPQKVLAGGCWQRPNSTEAAPSTSTPVTLSFANHLTNPSIILVGVANTNTTTINTPSDTAGNTYIDSGAGVVNLNASIYSQTWAIKLFYALNTHTTASNVISASNTSGQISMVAEEWTGGLTSSPVDQVITVVSGNTGSGGGQNMSVGPVTPTKNGELIVALSDSPNGNPIDGAAWNSPQQQCAYPSGDGCTTGYAYMDDVAQGMAAAFTGTWNLTNNSYYSIILVTLKAAVCNPPHIGIM